MQASERWGIAGLLGTALLGLPLLRLATQAPPVATLPTAAAVGCRAPEFRLAGIDRPDAPISLSGLRGRAVVLVFNCGCQPCVALDRLLVARAAELREAQLLAIRLNPWGEGRQDALRLRKATGFFWSILPDRQVETSIAYRSTECPRVWLIDREGVIRYTNRNPHAAPPAIVSELLAAYRNL